MEYSIISADSHIDLAWMPHDVFVSNAPTHLKDQMPRVVDTEKGLVWRAGEDELCLVGVLGAEETNPGVVARDKRMAETGFFEDSAKGIYHPTVPELRIKDQDLDGVDAEVIYGLSFGPEFLRNPKTRAWSTASTTGGQLISVAAIPRDSSGLPASPTTTPRPPRTKLDGEQTLDSGAANFGWVWYPGPSSTRTGMSSGRPRKSATCPSPSTSWA